MPKPFQWSGQPVEHPHQQSAEMLNQGLRLVGLTLQRAVTWSARIISEQGGPKLMTPADLLDERTAQQVLALLLAERSLIEFCLGPAASRRGGVWRKRLPNDLCPACFLGSWHVDRLPVALVDRLRSRKERIDRHAAHLTWTPALRGHRQWTAAALVDVVEAGEKIEGALTEAGSALAGVLGSSIGAVREELGILRATGPVELQPLAVAV